MTITYICSAGVFAGGSGRRVARTTPGPSRWVHGSMRGFQQLEIPIWGSPLQGLWYLGVYKRVPLLITWKRPSTDPEGFVLQPLGFDFRVVGSRIIRWLELSLPNLVVPVKELPYVPLCFCALLECVHGFSDTCIWGMSLVRAQLVSFRSLPHCYSQVRFLFFCLGWILLLFQLPIHHSRRCHVSDPNMPLARPAC